MNEEQETKITPMLVQHLQIFASQWLEEITKDWSEFVNKNGLDIDKDEWVHTTLDVYTKNLHKLQSLASFLEELYHNLIFELKE